MTVRQLSTHPSHRHPAVWRNQGGIWGGGKGARCRCVTIFCCVGQHAARNLTAMWRTTSVVKFVGCLHAQCNRSKRSQGGDAHACLFLRAIVSGKKENFPLTSPHTDAECDIVADWSEWRKHVFFAGFSLVSIRYVLSNSPSIISG